MWSDKWIDRIEQRSCLDWIIGRWHMRDHHLIIRLQGGHLYVPEQKCFSSWGIHNTIFSSLGQRNKLAATSHEWKETIAFACVSLSNLNSIEFDILKFDNQFRRRVLLCYVYFHVGLRVCAVNKTLMLALCNNECIWFDKAEIRRLNQHRISVASSTQPVKLAAEIRQVT